jgi:NAD(P)-dependent dehydrogenase (short-subunit alcohol dehydrogenase family)
MANVLITGCSSGFGLLTALGFARAGDRVFATMRNVAKGDELRRAATAEKLPLTVHQLDVVDPASVERAVAEALDAGPLDVLVNNAGIECRSSIEDADDEDVRRQFDTNVFGLLRVTRAVLPAMRKQKHGTIVNVSSIAGLVSRPYGGLYSATKHAIEAISEALFFEVQPFGIRVAMVEPGQYGTPLLANAFHGKRFDERSPYWRHSTQLDEALVRLRPDGRMQDPQEVADLIVALAKSDAPKLRNVAGADAVMLAAAHRQMEFEDFERAMRQTLDWKD